MVNDPPDQQQDNEEDGSVEAGEDWGGWPDQ